MSAQDDLFTAARSLHDQGSTAFSVQELLAATRRYGSTFPDSVLKRTFEDLIARADDPAHSPEVFVEVRKGWYRLRR